MELVGEKVMDSKPECAANGINAGHGDNDDTGGLVYADGGGMKTPWTVEFQVASVVLRHRRGVVVVVVVGGRPKSSRRARAQAR